MKNEQFLEVFTLLSICFFLTMSVVLFVIYECTVCYLSVCNSEVEVCIVFSIYVMEKIE